MKKIVYLLLIMFLIPIFVNAETLTYNVCESGCEYNSFLAVIHDIKAITNKSDKDIIINTDGVIVATAGATINDENDVFKSFSINIKNYPPNDWIDLYLLYAKDILINGNECTVDHLGLGLHGNNVEIKNINTTNDSYIYLKTNILKMSNVHGGMTFELDISNDDQAELSKILQMDAEMLKNINVLYLKDDFTITNMDLSNSVIQFTGNKLDVYDSKLGVIMSAPTNGDINVNIYNSKFNLLKHKNITTMEEYTQEIYPNGYSIKKLEDFNYSLFDLNIPDGVFAGTANTTAYFDKEVKLKPSDKLNLAEFLDYYTEDKDMEYTIEDESIAKIENKELSALKEGSTKVTVTTDEGHVVYNINLVVEKETIPEKIDKMTIKVPITGSKIKVWIVVVSAMLLGIVGVCIGMLVKNKKR